MTDRYRLASRDTIEADGSWLFTGRNGRGEDVEVMVVPCADDGGVRAWVNRCTHEDQRLHREGIGAVVRGGEVVCPKHGSTFDACSGDCDNGEAAGTTLLSVAVEAEDGDVYLTDDDVTYLYEGPADDDDDDGPDSTSHLQL